MAIQFAVRTILFSRWSSQEQLLQCFCQGLLLLQTRRRLPFCDQRTSRYERSGSSAVIVQFGVEVPYTLISKPVRVDDLQAALENWGARKAL